MRAHRTGYAAARSVRRGHVTAIRDVRPTALLICTEDVRADDLAVVFRDKDFMVGGEPKCECALAIHVSRQRIGFARANDWLQNCPKSIRVACDRIPNFHWGKSIGRITRLKQAGYFQSGNSRNSSGEAFDLARQLFIDAS